MFAISSKIDVLSTSMSRRIVTD